MNPYERMAAQYAAHPQERSFEWYCQWHMRHGFLFSTPDFFIMGRPANRSALEAFGLFYGENLHKPTNDYYDCWYLHAMSGNMEKAWSIMPWWLPWFSFHRVQGGKLDLRFVRAESIRRLCLSA